MLASLDKIQGVEQSFTNYSGTMIRVTVARSADKDKLAKEILKILGEEKRKPVRLTGDEFEQALRKEEWRDYQRVVELSEIEFRTLIVRRIRAFAEKEKLDKEVTDKLVNLAEEELRRIAKSASPLTDISQWKARYEEFARSVLKHELLTAPQLERLKEWLKQGLFDRQKGQRP